MRKSQAVALARTIVVIIGRTTINSDIWKQFLAIHVVFFCIFEIVKGHSMSDQRVFCDDLLQFVLNLARL